MAFINTRPIIADDPLAYFAALTPKPVRSEPPVVQPEALRVLDQMYAYYRHL